MIFFLQSIFIIGIVLICIIVYKRIVYSTELDSISINYHSEFREINKFYLNKDIK